jgi:hypothetical protein
VSSGTPVRSDRQEARVRRADAQKGAVWCMIRAKPMLMMMSPIQGAINYGREDKQIASALGLTYSHSNHEGLIAASCIEKQVR